MTLRVAIGLWLAVAISGFVLWHAYEVTPGEQYPPDLSILPATSRPSLQLFLHPRCPCSRATLSELTEILVTPNRAEVAVVFVRPDDAPDGWEWDELWDVATSLPNVQVRVDPGGIEARRAGARTSGYVVARDATGRVAFRGGITRARGKVGDSPGRQAIAAVLVGREPLTTQTPVFGCALFTPGQCSEVGTECTP